MKPNEVNPVAFDNIPAAALSDNDCSEKYFDMCTLQYYCPQPIIGAKLAHAYVPFQFLCCLYSPEMGLTSGTIFPELNRPYGADPAYTIG